MKRDILELVNDFAQWKGNTYTLANLVAEYVREQMAVIAETQPELATPSEVAAAIREAT